MTNQNSQMQRQEPSANPLRNALVNAFPRYMALLPADVPADKREAMAKRQLGITLAAIARGGDYLAKCSAASIVDCVLQAAQMNLEVGGLTGEAYFVPFKNSCTMIPGYRGLIKLARQSGEVSTVGAAVVYEGDEFEVMLGARGGVTHRPNLRSKRDPNSIVAVHSWIVFRDGGEQIEVMSVDDVNIIKSRSQTGGRGSGPWSTDFAEMAKKTVVRRMLKYAPLSGEKIRAAIEHEESLDAQERGEPVYNPVATDVPRMTGEERSKARGTALAGRIQNAHQGPPGAATEPDDFDPTPPPGFDAESDGRELPRDPDLTPAAAPEPMPNTKPQGKGAAKGAATKHARDGSDGSVPADQEPPEPAGREPGVD